MNEIKNLADAIAELTPNTHADFEHALTLSNSNCELIVRALRAYAPARPEPEDRCHPSAVTDERAEAFGAILKDEAKRLRARADELDPQTAARSAEPVAYVPLDGDKPMWSETHPRKLRDSDMALYAAPTTSSEPETLSSDAISTLQAKSPDAPSSPEPDAVREKLAAEINSSEVRLIAGEDRFLTDDERAILAAALSAPVAGAWEDISTAPKDGTWVLVWEDYGTNNKFSPADVARYELGYWQNGEKARVHNATHWMPLPGRPVPRNDRVTSQPDTGEAS